MELKEKEALLENHKASLQAWLQASQAMVDFSKMSLRGSMLLNGAGVIPIVYSKVEYLYDSAVLFGLGALLSACAAGMTYLVQWAITASWDAVFISHPFRTSSLDREEEKEALSSRIAYRAVLPLRCVAMLLVLGSLVCFALGLHEAYCKISAGL